MANWISIDNGGLQSLFRLGPHLFDRLWQGAYYANRGFPNHADYVYGPLATTLNDQMKDLFMRQTRLSLVNNNGDIVIEGEITGYNQFNEAIDASGYSSKVRLTLTVNVSYTNNTNHEEDFENRTFSAFQTYDASQLLTAVQDQLIEVMVKDISEQIFNSTVANW